MGAISTKMEEAMGKQIKVQKEMAMKQRQLQMAAQVAMGRERFRYQLGFYSVLLTILPIGAFATKNPKMLFPMLPISFIIAFQYDMLYGNMHIRMQREIASLIQNEPERFFMPAGNGLVTHQEYLDIVKVPSDYKPQITLESTFGHHGGENPYLIATMRNAKRKEAEMQALQSSLQSAATTAQ
uniref:Uncharacterized protein n=1 Tax=Strombidium rassoulzadegani TaxID=1082188 RepID=A0A7S3CHX9_9SPIT|mmetsp:Transcript_10595/g.17798  ORF Transcript_10595/g.17798 Transcript_10595/m.17798 type:complete len:183 (+) Transcript_10595:50-598(+)